jgi:glyoxylase I family protein
MTGVVGYHHLSLSVTDLGRSAEWYQKVLGLEVAAEITGDGFHRTRLRAPGSGVILTLTSHDQESQEPFSERRPGMDHVAFMVGGLADVETLGETFDQLGVTHSGVKSLEGGTAMITLRDPDNIQLEVFSGPADPAVGVR